MQEEREELIIKLLNAYKTLEFKGNLVEKNSEFVEKRNSAASRYNQEKSVLDNYENLIAKGTIEDQVLLDEDFFDVKGIKYFTVMGLIGVLLTLDVLSGLGWLDAIYNNLIGNLTGNTAVGVIVFIAFTITSFYIMNYIVRLFGGEDVFTYIDNNHGGGAHIFVGYIFMMGAHVGTAWCIHLMAISSNFTKYLLIALFIILFSIIGIIMMNKRRKVNQSVNVQIEENNQRRRNHNARVYEAEQNFNKVSEQVDRSYQELAIREKDFSISSEVYHGYVDSSEHQNSLKFLSHEKNLTLEAISLMYYIVSSGRADTLKEMLNKYDSMIEHQNLLQALAILKVELSSIQSAITEEFNKLIFEIQGGFSEVQSGFSNMEDKLEDINRNTILNGRMLRIETSALLVAQSKANKLMEENNRLSNAQISAIYNRR